MKEFFDNKWVRLTGISIGVFLFMKYAFVYLFPFLAGIVIVACMNPFLSRCRRCTRIGKGILLGSILFFLGCIPGVLLWLLAKWLIENASAFQKSCSMIGTELMDCLSRCCDAFERSGDLQDGSMERWLRSGIEMVSEKVETTYLPQMLGTSMELVKWIGLIGAVWAVFVIFCMMLAKDYDRIREKCNAFGWFRKVRSVALRIYRMLMSFFRTQLILMAIISTVVAVGTYLMGYSHWLALGLVIGFLDVLPFIGTGITLIPMALWKFVTGNVLHGVGCLVLYGLCVFIREYFEPKLMGSRTGIHPIILLITIYLGVPLFGIIGVLTGPIAYLMIAEIYREWGAAFDEPVDKSAKLP